jgi:hypothetical protein
MEENEKGKVGEVDCVNKFCFQHQAQGWRWFALKEVISRG